MSGKPRRGARGVGGARRRSAAARPKEDEGEGGAGDKRERAAVRDDPGRIFAGRAGVVGKEGNGQDRPEDGIVKHALHDRGIGVGAGIEWVAREDGGIAVDEVAADLREARDVLSAFVGEVEREVGGGEGEQANGGGGAPREG